MDLKCLLKRLEGATYGTLRWKGPRLFWFLG